ncbi:MAG: hypothetical protein AB7I30_07815 [Isosphaeraceae bacterium]
MNLDLLASKFARIGARLELGEGDPDRAGIVGRGPVIFNVRNDHKGEHFTIRFGNERAAPAEVEALDVQPDDRHLLILVRGSEGKSKYLCGHDERHWFVAAVPESAPVGTVRAAKEALKPREVLAAQARVSLGGKALQRRHNRAFRRQGEWFFVPEPALKVDPRVILRNEPIRRGNGGKAHWVDECHRAGGTTVYVCARHPGGLDTRSYQELLESKPEARHWGWRMMVREARVHVRGKVRHPDHKTITLHGWHRVHMNTENLARAMRNVAFLD